MSVSMFRDSLAVPAIGLVLAVVLGLGLPGCGRLGQPPSGGERATLITAEATLQLARFDTASDTADGGQHEHTNIESMMPRVLTECNQLRSDVTIQRLLETEEVRATGWYQQQPSNAAAHGALLDHVLVAAHFEDTTLIRVTATTESADDALAILRAWIAVYLHAVGSRAESRYHTDRLAFQRQIETVEAAIQSTEARLRQHLIEHPAEATAEQLDVTTRELLFLNAKHEEIEELLAAAVGAHRAMQLRNAEPYEPTPDELQAINQSQPILQLDAQIRQLRVSLESLIDGGRDESQPQVQQVIAQIQNLERERETEFDNQTSTIYNARVEMAAQAIEVYREQLASFSPRIEELRARVVELRALASDLEVMQRDLAQLELQRDQARRVYQDLELLIRRAGGYNVEVRTPPAVVEP